MCHELMRYASSSSEAAHQLHVMHTAGLTIALAPPIGKAQAVPPLSFSEPCLQAACATADARKFGMLTDPAMRGYQVPVVKSAAKYAQVEQAFSRNERRARY